MTGDDEQSQPSDRLAQKASATVVKRSVVIAGHRTSISLEDIFWQVLKSIARDNGQSIASLVAEIDAGRGEANLSSAIRVFVLERALDLRENRPSV